MNYTPLEDDIPYKLEYYHPDDKNTSLFIKIPNFIFNNPTCSRLSCNAKLLYGAFLDEMRFSAKNGLIDSENRLYIDFSIKKTCQFLGCSESTAKRVRKELRDCFGKNIGLVQFISHGQGHSDYIYVMNYITELDNYTKPGRSNPSTSAAYEPSKELKYDPLREIKNEPSREVIHGLPRETKSDPYIIENNKEREKRNNIYHLSSPSPNPGLIDEDGQLLYFFHKSVNNEKHTGPDPYTEALERIRNQIGYEQLLCYKPNKAAYIKTMIDIMAIEQISDSGDLYLKNCRYTRESVRTILGSIDLNIAKYVLDCIDNSRSRIRNLRGYILATLLNAPAAFEAQKDYDEQAKKNIFLHQDDNPACTKPSGRRNYDPYIGRSYTDEQMHAFEMKKLGITG